MKQLKYISLLTLYILMITASASSQIQKQKVKKTNTDAAQTFRQLFWDSLPKPVGYVNDFENIFSDDEEKILDSLIKVFEIKTTIQIAVITLDSNMTTADSLDLLTLRFANVWGVGQKDKDNGVTIGISRSFRRMRIQNSYGIEKVMSDMDTKLLINTAFIPYFRNSKYFEGTLHGVNELMNLLEQRYK